MKFQNYWSWISSSLLLRSKGCKFPRGTFSWVHTRLKFKHILDMFISKPCLPVQSPGLSRFPSLSSLQCVPACAMSWIPVAFQETFTASWTFFILQNEVFLSFSSASGGTEVQRYKIVAEVHQFQPLEGFGAVTLQWLYLVVRPFFLLENSIGWGWAAQTFLWGVKLQLQPRTQIRARSHIHHRVAEGRAMPGGAFLPGHVQAQSNTMKKSFNNHYNPTILWLDSCQRYFGWSPTESIHLMLTHGFVLHCGLCVCVCTSVSEQLEYLPISLRCLSMNSLLWSQWAKGKWAWLVTDLSGTRHCQGGEGRWSLKKKRQKAICPWRNVEKSVQWRNIFCVIRNPLYSLEKLITSL